MGSQIKKNYFFFFAGAFFAGAAGAGAAGAAASTFCASAGASFFVSAEEHAIIADAATSKAIVVSFFIDLPNPCIFQCAVKNWIIDSVSIFVKMIGVPGGAG